MSHRMAALALFGVTCLGAAAAADEGADKNALARKIVALTYSQPSYKKMVDAVSGQLPPEMRSEVANAMVPYQELADFQMGLFVKYYTVAELQQLLKFYTSPIGKKTLDVMPEIMQDVQGMVMTRLQAEMPKLIEKYKKRKADATAPANDAPVRDQSSPQQ